DEAVAKPVPDAEELAEAGEPRPALIRGAAREVREVDGRAGARELAEPVEPAGGEELRRRGEQEAGRARDAIALADERDRETRLPGRDVALHQRRPDVLPVRGRCERELALEVLGHEQRRVSADGLPARAELADEPGEAGELAELRLRPARRVGQP